MKHRYFFLLLLAAMAVRGEARDFHVGQGDTLFVHLPDDATAAPVVTSALQMLKSDFQAVLPGCVWQPAAAVRSTRQGGWLTGRINPALRNPQTGAVGEAEAFRLTVTGTGQLTVVGSDAHGLAYGLLEISRHLGVSPWIWWTDSQPQRVEKVSMKSGFSDYQAPAVRFRGIFINDEDWGLLPWATTNFEPAGDGRIGPRTSERIFQLLLRLRANTYWPPMHTCSYPFFLTEGNRATAERYGIYIGTSHCEPMAANTNGEWSLRGEGDYDYVHNSEAVRRFWEERVRDVAHQPILYTLGMRGVHDDAMNGARTVAEQRDVLTRVITDQRQLLAQYVNADVTQVPQVFIPYKEVLDVYEAGLSVPDDVTLMWTDDNYGYIRHFPTAAEQQRKGGNGLYYHVSYWGRPHDYLWLGTFSPRLLRQQMLTAFRHGIRRMWVLNVGDIKPAEYLTELFLDLAWMGERTPSVPAHLEASLCREFGTKTGRRLAPLMLEHYDLAFECKPEFLGGTRTEEADKNYWNTIHDLPWTETHIRRRLRSYERIEKAVEHFAADIRAEQRDCYLQLVKYPVQAAAEMNKKMLTGQLARHGRADWADSDAAYDSIRTLTAAYNSCHQGKWKGIMDAAPRRQPVFAPLPHVAATDSLPAERPWLLDANLLPISDDDAGSPAQTFRFKAEACDSVEVEVQLLPTLPLNGRSLRFHMELDGVPSPEADITTHGRSEEWKQNVLRNYAVRRFRLPLDRKSRHTLQFIPQDEGLVLTRVRVSAD